MGERQMLPRQTRRMEGGAVGGGGSATVVGFDERLVVAGIVKACVCVCVWGASA